MITKVNSLIDSEHVLNLVMNDEEVCTDIRCFVECYQNGREQGFLLWGFNKNDKAIYFANHRNSDQIVVYVGKYSMQGISDDAYRHAYFSNDHYDAKEYIIKTAKELSTK